MDQLMTAQESYVERRRLFKDIWATAMNIDERDAEFLSKPKVIKTLRLDSVDRSAGKKKKQKIRNLRTVCNKILDFCDKQDADDLFYAQVTAEGHISPARKMEPSAKKQITKIKKKVKKSKSMFSPHREFSAARATTSEQKGQIVSIPRKTSRNTSPVKWEPPIITKKPVTTNKSSAKAEHVKTVMNTPLKLPQRKVFKKKISKRKKPDDLTPPPGTVVRYNFAYTPFVGRLPIGPPKKLLKMHKVSI